MVRNDGLEYTPKRTAWYNTLTMWRRLFIVGVLLVATAGLVADSSSSIPRTNAKNLKERITKLKGKVVLVNFWATWCQPCMEEMPDLVKLDNNYRKRGVTLLGVSVDDAEVADEVIPPVLKKHKVKYPVMVVNQDPDEFIEQFDSSWRGEVPRFYLYSKSGKLLKSWSGKSSYQKLEREIKEALKAR